MDNEQVGFGYQNPGAVNSTPITEKYNGEEPKMDYMALATGAAKAFDTYATNKENDYKYQLKLQKAKAAELKRLKAQDKETAKAIYSNWLTNPDRVNVKDQGNYYRDLLKKTKGKVSPGVYQELVYASQAKLSSGDTTYKKDTDAEASAEIESKVKAQKKESIDKAEGMYSQWIMNKGKVNKVDQGSYFSKRLAEAKKTLDPEAYDHLEKLVRGKVESGNSDYKKHTDTQTSVELENKLKNLTKKAADKATNDARGGKSTARDLTQSDAYLQLDDTQRAKFLKGFSDTVLKDKSDEFKEAFLDKLESEYKSAKKSEIAEPSNRMQSRLEKRKAQQKAEKEAEVTAKKDRSTAIATITTSKADTIKREYAALTIPANEKREWLNERLTQEIGAEGFAGDSEYANKLTEKLSGLLIANEKENKEWKVQSVLNTLDGQYEVWGDKKGNDGVSYDEMEMPPEKFIEEVHRDNPNIPVDVIRSHFLVRVVETATKDFEDLHSTDELNRVMKEHSAKFKRFSGTSLFGNNSPKANSYKTDAQNIYKDAITRKRNEIKTDAQQTIVEYNKILESQKSGDTGRPIAMTNEVKQAIVEATVSDSGKPNKLAAESMYKKAVEDHKDATEVYEFKQRNNTSRAVMEVIPKKVKPYYKQQVQGDLAVAWESGDIDKINNITRANPDFSKDMGTAIWGSYLNSKDSKGIEDFSTKIIRLANDPAGAVSIQNTLGIEKYKEIIAVTAIAKSVSTVGGDYQKAREFYNQAKVGGGIDNIGDKDFDMKIKEQASKMIGTQYKAYKSVMSTVYNMTDLNTANAMESGIRDYFLSSQDELSSRVGNVTIDRSNSKGLTGLNATWKTDTQKIEEDMYKDIANHMNRDFSSMKYMGKNHVLAMDESGQVIGIYNTSQFVKHLNDETRTNMGYEKDAWDVTADVFVTSIVDGFDALGEGLKGATDAFTNMITNKRGVMDVDDTVGVGMRR